MTEASASDTATVTVLEPDIQVTPASLASTLPVGGSETQPLDIHNAGTADLDWTIDEAPAPLVGPIHRTPTAVLFDNGPLVTHPGGGAGGLDASALQDGSLGMTIFGYGNQITAGNRVADDFTVPGPAPWNITTVTFFGYQTGSGITPSINDVRLQIWDGPPNAGGTIIYGDLTTNRLATATFSNIYRVLEGTLTNADRPIMALVVNVNTSLPPGTYWLDWTVGGSGAFSGPWAPPVTILGSTGTGNALQWIPSAWAALVDVGPQDFPFVIEGTSSPCDTPADVPWLSITPTAGTTVPGATSTLDVTFDATGLVAGNVYDGLVCVFSNDPDTSLVEVPVELTVTADTMPFLDGFETGDTSQWSFTVP